MLIFQRLYASGHQAGAFFVTRTGVRRMKYHRVYFPSVPDSNWR